MVLFRRGTQRASNDQVALLTANLPEIAGALASGCVVVIEPDRLRIRDLPLLP